MEQTADSSSLKPIRALSPTQARQGPGWQSFFALPIVLLLENLRTSVEPYGGDLFLLMAVLAIASYVALLYFKNRLDAALLRRFLRVAALVALLVGGAMQMGEQYFAAALLPLV